MAILPIRTFGDPALRERARPVEKVTDVHQQLIDDMIETMRDAPGVGLAAPQVGVLERIFVWEVDEEHGAVINPRIVTSSADTAEEEEGCLSLPGLYYPVERPAAVVVEGLDRHGQPVQLDATELLARVCQHEIDHLDGVLFVDRLREPLKKEALQRLRDQALGLEPAPASTAPAAPREEIL
ncbi:MAG TPA: peptide deformylase [Actinomycetota bacterium]|nr:peptide deformylase [Actinomycetota bacterium]